MAPFDQPALAAAKVRGREDQPKGGVNGRPLKIVTCDTQGNKPASPSRAAPSWSAQGATIIFTTCDVDYATPVVQEAINAGLLTIAPCIGTDQMGPSRFGAKGELAFSFGNVAQDEGSAMAAVRLEQGLEDGGHPHQHAARVLQGGRAGLPDPLQAARRQDRLAGLVHRPARTTWATPSAS